jgi:hypothetical protein
MPNSTEPPVAPPPTFVLVPAPVEDAGATSDADADAPRGYGKPADLTGLRTCCAALAQNAASMPPPQNMYAANAAAYCQAMVASVNSPAQKDAMLAGVRSALRGAGVPSACH